MRLIDVVQELGLKVITNPGNLNREITGGYASDLMSDAIAHANPGELWVTLQVHQNVVAIASMKELGGVVLTQGREPLAETAKKAELEEIPLLSSDLSAFELIGRLYQIGIHGS